MTDNLAEDWVALWQSELTAMAADRELRESFTAMMTLWASTANASLRLLTPNHDIAGRNPETLQPQGSAPIAAAFEPSLDEIANLNRRIAELERRLAGLEPEHPDP